MIAGSAQHPIHGTWKMVSAVLSGEKSPEMVTDNVEIEIAGGTYSVRFQGNVADHGRIEIPDSGTLQLHGIKGPNQGKTIPALFQHKGDLLRICYGLDGKLPPDFKSEVGSPHYLVLYRRKV